MNWYTWYRISVVLVLLTLVTPLIVAPQTMVFPFITPKIFLVRLLIEGALMTTLVALYQQPLLRGVSGGLLSRAWMVYAISLVLSVIFGVSAYHSWWSGHERMLGVYSVLHYVVLFFVGITLFRGYAGEEIAGRKLYGFKVVLNAMLGMVMVLSVIAIAQRLGDAPILFAQPGGRVYATLGNFIYLGNVMATGVFVACLLAYKEKKYRIAYLLWTIPLLAALMFAESRGATLGLLGGVMTAAGTYALLAKKKLRGIALGVMAGMIGLVALIFIPHVQLFLQSTPLARVTSLNIHDASPRIIAWGVAFESWKQKPIFGWGFENFMYAFNANFNPRSTEFSYYETWFDSAHNIFLNTLATTGVVGLLSYLALYGVTAYHAIVRYRRAEWSAFECVTIVGLLTTDLLSKVFVFDHPTSYLMLTLVTAYVCVTTRVPITKPLKSLVVYGSVIMVMFLMVATNVMPARANSAIITMIKQTSSTSSEIEFESAVNEALNLSSPYSIDLTQDIARQLRSTIVRINISEDRKIMLVNRVVERLDGAIEKNPYELHLYIAKSELLQILPRTEERYQQLMKVFDDAIAYSPRRQQLYFMRAQMQGSYGKFDDAIATVNTAEQINPAVMYTPINRGLLNAEKGDIAAAWKDISFATLTHRAVPQSYTEFKTAWYVYAQSGFPNFWYAFNMRLLAEPYGLDITKEELVQLAKELKAIGAYSAAADVEFTLLKVHGVKTEASAVLATTNAHERTLGVVDHYKKAHLYVPFELYAALFVLNDSDAVIRHAMIGEEESRITSIVNEVRACAKNYTTQYQKLYHCAR